MPTNRRTEWLYPLLVLFTLWLGALGFHQYGILHREPTNWLSALYLSLQLFVINSGGVPEPIPLTLEISRFLAPALTAGGIFLALWKPIHQRYQLTRIRSWKNHVVVCGLSRKAELIIHDFLKQSEGKTKIVIIEANANHPGLSHMKQVGAVILTGEATDREILEQANVFHADYLLALTQDEKTNIQIAHRVAQLFNEFRQKLLPHHVLQTIIHIDDFYTLNIFKEFHEKVVPDAQSPGREQSHVDFHTFSIFQLAAMHMVDSYSPDHYRKIKSPEDRPAHVLIQGDTLAAQYLILEAAQMYHFANLSKTRITVLADDISPIAERVETLYPFLDEQVDIHYVRTWDFYDGKEKDTATGIDVCFIALEDDGKGIHAARKLRQKLFNEIQSAATPDRQDPFGADHTLQSALPPIKVLLPRNTALVNIFDDITRQMQTLNIELINIDQEVCNKHTIVDNRKAEDFIAKHIHYEWAKRQRSGQPPLHQSIDEEWDRLNDLQKDANRLPARHLFIKLRFAHAAFSEDLSLPELEVSTLDQKTWNLIARMEHNRWVAEKAIASFILSKRPANKEEAAFIKNYLKLHWDLVPFDQLDKPAQVYDEFTFRMAPTIASLSGKRLVRLS